MSEHQPNKPPIPESQHTPHEGGNGSPSLPLTINERAKPPPEKNALNRAVEWTRELYERNDWIFLPLGEAGKSSALPNSQTEERIEAVRRAAVGATFFSGVGLGEVITHKKGKAHSPEHRAKISEAVRRNWQSRNPLTPEERAEKKRKRMRDYRKNNKDKVNEYQRRHHHEGPKRTNEKLIEYQRQRYWERVAKEEEESANDPSTDFAQIEQRLREALQIFPSPRQKK